MKRLTGISAVLFLAGTGMFVFAKPVNASCTTVPKAGNYTVSTSCQFPFAAVDGVDTSSGNNTAVLTISTTKALTVGDGQTIVAGSIDLTASSVSINFVGTGKINPGTEYHIYALDEDGDGSPSSTTFALSQGAGYVRRGGLTSATNEDTWATSTNIDCGPNDLYAGPGQTGFYTTSFTNNLGNASFDWNCDGVETQQNTQVYTCVSCTNGSGYASINPTLGGTVSLDDGLNQPSNGWLTSAPGCGNSGARYTVNSTGCKDPAPAPVACTNYITSLGNVTQACN